MAEVAFSQRQVATVHQVHQVHSAMGSAQFPQEIVAIELLPNPDFVFPAASVDAQPTLGNWNSLTRRPRSDQNLAASANNAHLTVRQRQSASVLPNFTFNPSNSGQTSPTLSTPPHSPLLNAPATPSRGARHRRGGSELIGGGSISVAKTSPVKVDVASSAPLTLGPPPGRRHVHRRSGAISCHDLQSILQPKDANVQTRGGSAPATPLDTENKPFFSPDAERRSLSQSSLQSTDPSCAAADSSPQRRPPSRARVGFSERVEYIRPLSTISSETESSMSTIRGHSASGSRGSLSSVISAGAASPPSSRMARPSLNTTFEHDAPKERPHTAGNVLDAATKSVEALRLNVNLQQRPKSASSPPTSPSDSSPTTRPKRKNFPWWDSKHSQLPPPQSHIPSSGSDPSLSASPPDSPTSFNDSVNETSKCGNAMTAQKNPRKVKSWAHSFISRKPKSKKEISTPAASEDAPVTERPLQPAFNFEPNFDDDNTVTIISEPFARVATRLEAQASSSNLSSEPDAASPVIDLDAALGPFNTPPLSSNTRAGASRHPPRARRSMHSLAFSSGFASGTQIHRRTESAPELPPFDLRTPKVAPAAVMPDVFEEEDEEDVDSRNSDSTVRDTTELKDEEESNTGVHIVEVDESAIAITPWAASPGFGTNRRKKSEGLAISTDSAQQSPTSVQKPQSEESSKRSSNSSSVEVVGDYDSPRDRETFSDTITPPLTAENEKESQGMLRFSIPIPPHHLMTPDTLSGSSFSSPDFNGSQASLDTPRLGTGTSSMNEGRSFPFGEPGPEVRVSVDDVPSLTSSRSTMTSPVNHMQVPPSSAGRSASVYSAHSSTLADLRRKRGSIASLSKLVSANFGEKSKLSIESRPMSQHVLPVSSKERRGSRHRLSKLLAFWKGKEGKQRSGSK